MTAEQRKEEGREEEENACGGVVMRVGGSAEEGGRRELEMEAGEGVGVLIALERSGLFVCLPLLLQTPVCSVFAFDP